jgi:hypothetical protein
MLAPVSVQGGSEAWFASDLAHEKSAPSRSHAACGCCPFVKEAFFILGRPGDEKCPLSSFFYDGEMRKSLSNTTA